MKTSGLPRIIWNIQRTLLVTTGIVVLSLSTVCLSASEFSQYAKSLTMSGVITTQATEDGYRLGDAITRAEITKIAMGIAGGGSAGCSGTIFSDVGSGLGDLCGFIESAANSGVVSMGNTMFRPLDPVTRIEMVKILLAAMHITPSDTPSGFSDIDASAGDLYRYLNTAVEEGIVSQTNLFHPNDRASRGEVFKIAINTQNLSQATTTTTTTTPIAPIAPAIQMVSIQNFTFSPSPITVKVGTKVIWENKDSVGHTVTFDSFGSQLLSQNDRYEYTFTQTGTYQYRCTPHPKMLGTVIVTH